MLIILYSVSYLKHVLMKCKLFKNYRAKEMNSPPPQIFIIQTK